MKNLKPGFRKTVAAALAAGLLIGAAMPLSAEKAEKEDGEISAVYNYHMKS